MAASSHSPFFLEATQFSMVSAWSVRAVWLKAQWRIVGISEHYVERFRYLLRDL